MSRRATGLLDDLDRNSTSSNAYDEGRRRIDAERHERQRES